MPLPIDAIWFSDAKTIVLSINDSEGPTLFCKRETVERLGPRASSDQRRYWRMEKQRLIRLVAVEAGSTYELFAVANGMMKPLVLDPGTTGDDGLYLVSYRPEDAPATLQLEFFTDKSGFVDPGTLHRRARDVLRLGPRTSVEHIWSSPLDIREGRIHLGPAQPVWPYGRARRLALNMSWTEQRQRFEITGSTDHQAVDIDAQPALVRLSPADPEAIVLLTWRRVFAERLTAGAGSALLQAFEQHIERHLQWSIAFNHVPAKPNAVERPIACGHFFFDTEMRPSLAHPGQPVSLSFEGPFDIHDIAMLCVCSHPEDQITILQQQPETLPPRIVENEGVQHHVLCWQATIEGLRPLSWDEVPADIRSALTEQREAELRKRAASTGHPEHRCSALAGGASEAEERASVQRGALLDAEAFFAVDPELRGVLDDWFSSLDTDTLARLYASLPQEPIPFTNIARFLPVAINGMLDSPANWTVFERDAEALYKRMPAVAGAPAGHLRSNIRIWRAITSAMTDLQIFDKAQIQAIEAFSPNESSAVELIDPARFYAAAQILGELEQAFQQHPPSPVPANNAPQAAPAATGSPQDGPT
jgi:hypothetical protein